MNSRRQSAAEPSGSHPGGFAAVGEPTVAPTVAFVNIAKQYPNGVKACQGISLTIRPGSVHAIIGENGAGKSTLMKMLYGMEQPTSGSILLDGEHTTLASPHSAIESGIGMVHQSFMLVPTFTLAQNIVLGAEPLRRGLLDTKKAVQQVSALASDYQLAIDPLAKAQDVSVGMLQRAEILKALYRGARVLVLDEPTAVLTPQETTELFRAMRALAAAGRSVVFISHKLREVLAVADDITVMRGGKVVAHTNPENTDESQLASLMVGRDISNQVRQPSTDVGETVLAVRGLSCVNDLLTPACIEMNFEVAAGEIVGIVGVEGNGQTELIEAIAGMRSTVAGEILLDGKDLARLDVKERRHAGVSHIPEDRMKNGAALTESINDNLIVDRYDTAVVRRGPFLDAAAIAANGERLIDQFGVRAADGYVPIGSLSGGNIQKVIVARELTASARVVLAAQPTRGVDVGAMEFIYSQLRAARDGGAGVLLVSADLSEALALSDRLLVVKDGRIVARFNEVGGLTEEEVGSHMLGAAASSTAKEES